MVKDELTKVQRDGMLPGGVLLTGAAVKIPGVIDLAREVLNLPVQIGFPTNYEGVVDRIEDPSYATVIGLVIWGSRFQGDSYRLKLDLKNFSFDKMVQGTKNWLRGLLP